MLYRITGNPDPELVAVHGCNYVGPGIISIYCQRHFIVTVIQEISHLPLPILSFLFPPLQSRARIYLPDTAHSFPDLTLPIGTALEAVGGGLEVHHGLVDGLLGGGHEGAVLDDVLVEGLAREDDEVGGFAGALFDVRRHLVAGLLEHHVVVGRDGLAFWLVAVRERHGTLERVRECVPARGEFLFQLAAGLEGHVQEPDGSVCEVLE